MESGVFGNMPIQTVTYVEKDDALNKKILCVILKNVKKLKWKCFIWEKLFKYLLEKSSQKAFLSEALYIAG